MSLGFKPQALNYSAQAEAALRKLAPLAVRNGNADEAEIMIWLADQIRDAVHFLMPEDGRVFDDKFRGIKGSEVHLPFPKITLEYQAVQDPGMSTEGKPLYKATRRTLIAMELTAQELLDLAGRFFKGIPLPEKYSSQMLNAFPDGVIFVTGLFYIAYEEDAVWSPCYAAWLLPIKGWDEHDPSKAIQPLRERDRDSIPELGVSGRPFPVFWRAWTDMVDRMGQGMTDRYIANDIGAEAFVVLELIEALSCSNIKMETIQPIKPGVNARRVRDGKLPLYETKVLTIDVVEGRKGAGGQHGGTHASPRQHLRRGHIRELQSGKRIWVQAHSVGTTGAIRKTYKIKAK